MELLSKNQNRVLNATIVISPFIIYYFAISYVFYKNFFYLFFIHSYLFYDNEQPIKILLTTWHPLSSFLQFNPIIWISAIIFLVNQEMHYLKKLYLSSLLLILVAYLGRILIPIAFFSTLFLGLKMPNSKKGIIISSMIFLSQVVMIALYNPAPGESEYTFPYKIQVQTYQRLEELMKAPYTYYIYPFINPYLLWQDNECSIAPKTIFIPKSFLPCQQKNKGLFPDGEYKKFPDRIHAITTAPAFILRDGKFQKLFLAQHLKILEHIPSENTIIMQCK